MIAEFAKFVSICLAATGVILIGCFLVVFVGLSMLNRSIGEDNDTRVTHGTAEERAVSNYENSAVPYEGSPFFLQQEFAKANAQRLKAIEDARNERAQTEKATRNRIAGYENARSQSELTRSRMNVTTAESKKQSAASRLKVELAADQHAQSLRSRKGQASSFGGRTSGHRAGPNGGGNRPPGGQRPGGRHR